MTDCVWWVAFAGAITNRNAHSVIRPAKSAKERIEAWINPIEQGLRLDPSDRPQAFRLNYKELKNGKIENTDDPIIGPNGYRLSYSFFQDYPMIAHEAIDVFEQFDLGEAQLFPVDFFKTDEVTPHAERVTLVVPANPKNSFRYRDPAQPEKDENHPNIKGAAARVNYASNILGKIFVTEAALSGPDIWSEPSYFDTYFISDRLATALGEAGVADDFHLQKATVIDSP